MTACPIQQQANIHRTFFTSFVTKYFLHVLYLCLSVCASMCCSFYLCSSLSPLSHCSFFFPAAPCCTSYTKVGHIHNESCTVYQSITIPCWVFGSLLRGTSTLLVKGGCCSYTSAAHIFKADPRNHIVSCCPACVGLFA